MREGYIYVLLNRALQKDHYKIGKTTKDPFRRANELSTATGVPRPFEVIYHERVADCDQAERLIHVKLARHRISGGKEFFQTTLKPVIDAIQEAAGTVGRVADNELPESRGSTAHQRPPEPLASEGEIDVIPPDKPKGSPQKQSEKERLYLRFWKRLLEKIRQETERFDDIRPTAYYYVQMLAGPERGIVFYFALNESSLRVEIFFNTGDSERNTELYEKLERNRPNIEGKFTVPLEWRFGKTCGVKYTFGRGCYRNEEDWEALITPALDSLLLFERTLEPYL